MEILKHDLIASAPLVPVLQRRLPKYWKQIWDGAASEDIELTQKLIY